MPTFIIKKPNGRFAYAGRVPKQLNRNQRFRTIGDAHTHAALHGVEAIANTAITYTAEQIGPKRYAVRPRNTLGTCGFYPVTWTVTYVTAGSHYEALNRARSMRRLTGTN